MNIVIIDGMLGAGKTLGMTILTNYYTNMSNATLYSNYNVKGSQNFSHYTDFLKIAEQKSSIIALDEAHADLDSRNHSNNSVKFFSHLSFYFRKLRTTLFLTTPAIENVDIRIRRLTQLYIQVSKDNNNYYYDYYDLQSLRYLKTKYIPKEKAHKLASILYDTYNIVEPVEFPPTKKEFDLFIKELKNKSEQFYLKK